MAKHIRHTGNGVMNYTLDLGKQIQLEEIRLTLVEVGATSENFITRIESGKGDQYNCTLNTQDMNTLYSELYQPTRPHIIDAGDQLLFSYSNTDGSTWGLEIVYR